MSVVDGVGAAQGSRVDEPIAIVGMAFRFPPAIDSVQGLWRLMMAGLRTVRPVPRQRWEPHVSASPEVAGLLRKTVRHGSFLDDIEGFDANFFGISPREAAVMDPQQRIALEVVWRALEHAGIPPRRVADSDTGVFMGVADSDYGRQLLSDLPRVDAMRISGGMHYGVANRISHFYDLHGPSMAVDTACSSSMTAIHLAVQSLRLSQVPLALAGGTHLMIGPAPLLGLTDAGTTSMDGTSKPFDAAADGYGRGEGVGVLALKRLSDARRDGDRVLATIVASTCNQDGWTPGMMAPSTPAQAHMLRTLYDRVGIATSTVDYVEAHGTGTAVGDPIEVAALAEVVGRGRAPDDPCLIGSLKFNTGHLESASGVAGVIKTVLCMRAGLIPPTPSCSGTLSPAVDWPGSGLRVVDEVTEWPRRGHPRRAGVSSFGAGGTIGHVVLEQAPDDEHGLVPSTRAPGLFVCSSMSAAGLRDNAARLGAALRDHPRPPLESVAHTLMARRSHLVWRGAVVASDSTELVRRLETLSRGEPAAGVASGRVLGDDAGPVWVFSGQGAQWPSMGASLLATEPVFGQVVDELTPIFVDELGIDPRRALVEDELSDIAHIQALSFLMHTALAAVWRSHGVQPAAVVGHSLGEIAAAVAAGVFSVHDGARLACRRSRLMRAVRGRGAMAMVGLPPTEVARLLADSTTVTVAVHASPTSTVVSGDSDAVAEWCGRWEAEQVFVRRVRTDIASHSAHMDPLLADIAAATTDLTVTRPCIPLYTTALPDPRAQDERTGAYWQANLRDPVRFAQAITAAADDGHRVFLEISSHPIVTHSITETLAQRWDIDECATAHSLRRDAGGPESILANLAALYCAGTRIDVTVPRYRGQLVDLPGMAWQHHRFWTTPSIRAGGHDPDDHTLLGAATPIAAATTQRLWQTVLDAERRPMPHDHQVGGVDIVPASVLLNTFLNAARQAGTPSALTDIDLRAPLPVGAAREVQVVLRDDSLALCSRPCGPDPGDAGWLTHTTALLSGATDVAEPALRPRSHGEAMDHNGFVDLLGTLGVAGVGFDWQVSDLRRGTDGVQAHLNLPTTAASDWAPLLDGAMTIAVVLMLDAHTPRMLTHIQRVAVRGRPPAAVTVNAQRDHDGNLDIWVTEPDGTPVASLGGMATGELDAGNPGHSHEPRHITHQLQWHLWVPAHPSRPPKRVIVVTPDGAIPDWLDHALQITHAIALGLDDLPAHTPSPDSTVVVVPAGRHVADTAQAAEANTWLLLRTVQILADLPPGTHPRLWCLTHATTTLAHAPLLGAQRAVAGEHPELWGGHIDVTDTATLDGPTLLTVLSDTAGEDTYRIDGATVRVARLTTLEQSADRPTRTCRADSTYLITGGLGGLGAQTARWLAHRGARRLILLNRTELPPRSEWDDNRDPVLRNRIATIRELEAVGVTVRVVAADIADADATRQALARATWDMPPVRGVVHTAGISKNQLIAHIDPPALHAVLRPKIHGTLVLHELFPPGSLDFLVLFSSTGQLIRNTGQAGYAAANAFLDAFALHRRPDTLTLAWPGWRGLGLYATATDIFRHEMAASGTGDISADTAFQCWEYAERRSVPYAAVLPLTAHPTGTAPPPLLSELSRPHTPVDDPAPEAMTDWKDLPREQQRAHLTEQVTNQISQELLMPPDDIDPRRALLEMGLDSRMALSLRVRLEHRTGVKLPATVLWNHPTLNDLVTYLQQLHNPL